MEKKEALILEYQNIKQEIFTLMTRIDQLLVIEYTVAMALLGIGIEKENSFSYMLVLIFMIPIQEMINSRRRHMARASAYIEEVIEKEIKELKWEESVANIDCIYSKKHFQSNILKKGYGFFANNAALMIAMVSYCLYLRQKSIMTILVTNIISLTHENFIDVFGAIFLFGCLLVIVRQSVTYSDFQKLRKEYTDIIGEMKNGKNADNQTVEEQSKSVECGCECQSGRDCIGEMKNGKNADNQTVEEQSKSVECGCECQSGRDCQRYLGKIKRNEQESSGGSSGK